MAGVDPFQPLSSQTRHSFIKPTHTIKSPRNPDLDTAEIYYCYVSDWSVILFGFPMNAEPGFHAVFHIVFNVPLEQRNVIFMKCAFRKACQCGREFRRVNISYLQGMARCIVQKCAAQGGNF